MSLVFTVNLTTVSGRLQNCVADNRTAVTVFKVSPNRRYILVIDDAVEQMGDLMDKGVLPANHMPLWPPIFPPRVERFRDKHILEPLGLLGLFADPEDFHFVHAFKIEGDRALFAVDLKAVAILAATGKAG